MDSRLSRKDYYLAMLDLVAARSTCARRAVGAIITDSRGSVLSTGYNGVPRSFNHCTDVNCLGASDVAGNTSNCMAVHGEQNALLQCRDLREAHTMYISCSPCFVCAKMICNTDIKRVVCKELYADQKGVEVLKLAGIEVVFG